MDLLSPKALSFRNDFVESMVQKCAKYSQLREARGLSALHRIVMRVVFPPLIQNLGAVIRRIRPLPGAQRTKASLGLSKPNFGGRGKERLFDKLLASLPTSGIGR